jgi:hypothetical protein
VTRRAAPVLLIALAALAISGCGGDETTATGLADSSTEDADGGTGDNDGTGGLAETGGEDDADGEEPWSDGAQVHGSEGEGSEADDDGAADDQGDGAGDPGDEADDGSGDGSTGGAGTDDGPLPGTPSDIGPAAGERLDVVGVRHDDVLNFRTHPDPGAPIVATVAPRTLVPLVTSAGEGRLLDRSVWWKVTVGGQEAWANFAFLGMLGRTSEVTAEVGAGLASPEASSVDALIAAIAASRSDGPEPRLAYVTEVEERPDGDRSVIVDVTRLGDDAVKGERLTLTLEPSPRGYRLGDATGTLICGRGVARGGLCL